MRPELTYDTFIRTALAAGFTDDQADWLWESFAAVEETLKDK